MHVPLLSSDSHAINPFVIFFLKKLFIVILQHKSNMFVQVMEKLVDIVHFLHLEIHEAFGSAGEQSKQSFKSLANENV